MGGIVTAVAEARRPGLFRRIAMLDPPIHPTPKLVEALGLELDPGPARSESSLVEQTLRRRATWPSRDAARAGWRDKPMFAAMSEQAFELYLQEGLADQDDGTVALKCAPAVEAHVFETTNELDVLDYGPKVTAPVLLAHAERGHFPLALYESLADVFPHCTLIRLPAGHLLPLEAWLVGIQAAPAATFRLRGRLQAAAAAAPAPVDAQGSIGDAAAADGFIDPVLHLLLIRWFRKLQPSCPFPPALQMLLEQLSPSCSNQQGFKHPIG